MAWNNKGLALNSQGKYNESIEAYDEAIKLDPKYANAWNNKGNALQNQGKYDESIEAYDEAIKLDPKFAHGLGIIKAMLSIIRANTTSPSRLMMRPSG